MRNAYEIVSEQGQVVIRFDSDLIDREALTRFLDYLEMESIRKRSELTEEQAASLSDEIDRAVWKKVKHKYTGA